MPMRPHDVMSPSTLDAARLAGEIQAGGRSPGGPPGAWQVPLLLAADVEVWLLGWPAGQVTPAHDHGGSAVALTVVEGTLSEECLDPTIWTTGRRTTWRAGSTTVFPPDHVHVLGAAGGRPAVAAQLSWALAGALMVVVGWLGLPPAAVPPPLGAAAPGRRSSLRTVRWMSGTSGIGYPADQPAV